MNINYQEFKKQIHKPFYEHLLTELFFRKLSNYVAFLFIKYFNFIKANHITSFSLIIILVSTFLVYYGTIKNNDIIILFGLFGLIFFHFLDVLDGDLARSRIKILKEKPTKNGSYYDALMHQYYNIGFYSSLGFFLSYNFNNYIFLVLGIIAGLSLIINDLIMCFKSKIVNEDKDEKNYRNFKNSSKLEINLKNIIFSFIGIMGFSIIAFVIFLLEKFLNTGYIVLTIFFITISLAAIIVHIIEFYKFNKLEK